jgi:hypothetical protein
MVLGSMNAMEAEFRAENIEDSGLLNSRNVSSKFKNSF